MLRRGGPATEQARRLDWAGKLRELGVLSRELADSLAPSAGLRTRLVHEYAALDDAKVLAPIAVMLDLYPRYIQAVEAYLVKNGV
jgi:uncharacterized protein YutE (UPF0331/DUF86 family)